jgi:hypothetical protein
VKRAGTGRETALPAQAGVSRFVEARAAAKSGLAYPQRLPTLVNVREINRRDAGCWRLRRRYAP